mgnify:CR=1 FL=1
MGGLKRERNRVRRYSRNPRASARSIDHAGVEGLALATPQDVEHVPDTPVGAGERTADLIGLEKDEVHAGR